MDCVEPVQGGPFSSSRPACKPWWQVLACWLSRWIPEESGPRLDENLFSALASKRKRGSETLIQKTMADWRWSQGQGCVQMRTANREMRTPLFPWLCEGRHAHCADDGIVGHCMHVVGVIELFWWASGESSATNCHDARTPILLAACNPQVTLYVLRTYYE